MIVTLICYFNDCDTNLVIVMAGSWFYCKFTNTMSFNVIIYISLNLTGIGSPTFSNTYILSSKNLRGFPPLLKVSLNYLTLR